MWISQDEEKDVEKKELGQRGERQGGEETKQEDEGENEGLERERRKGTKTSRSGEKRETAMGRGREEKTTDGRGKRRSKAVRMTGRSKQTGERAIRWEEGKRKEERGIKEGGEVRSREWLRRERGMGVWSAAGDGARAEGKGGGGREKKREERSEGCLDSEPASNGVFTLECEIP